MGEACWGGKEQLSVLNLASSSSVLSYITRCTVFRDSHPLITPLAHEKGQSCPLNPYLLLPAFEDPRASDLFRYMASAWSFFWRYPE